MTIDGYSDSRFREVFQAFLTNFEQGAEIEAAVAVYYKGKPVVDLAAGLKDGILDSPIHGTLCSRSSQ